MLFDSFRTSQPLFSLSIQQIVPLKLLLAAVQIFAARWFVVAVARCTDALILASIGFRAEIQLFRRRLENDWGMIEDRRQFLSRLFGEIMFAVMLLADFALVNVRLHRVEEFLEEKKIVNVIGKGESLLLRVKCCLQT